MTPLVKHKRGGTVDHMCGQAKIGLFSCYIHPFSFKEQETRHDWFKLFYTFSHEVDMHCLNCV